LSSDPSRRLPASAGSTWEKGAIGRLLSDEER
jgi:hypothetical protein